MRVNYNSIERGNFMAKSKVNANKDLKIEKKEAVKAKKNFN